MAMNVIYQDVGDAAHTLDGTAHDIPVMTSSRIDSAPGHRVFLKCVNLQRTGSFIAGQGTLTRELLQEIEDLDVLLVPSGGARLVAWACEAARALAPRCRVYGFEPAAGDDDRQSLRSGRGVHIDTPQTLADGAQTLHPDQLTLPVIQRDAAGIHTVADEDPAAMRTLATTTQTVVESTGCLVFAALKQVPELDQRVGVVINGGNVGLDRYASRLQAIPKVAGP